MTSQREPFTCLYRGIWNDDKFWLRSELGQRVYLYVLSTPLGNGLGCFKAGMAAMAEDLRMLPSRFAEGFGEGFDERYGEPLFDYDEGARVVFIPKYLERNPPSNPNGIRALAKAFVSIPDCKLKLDCYQTVKAFVERKNPTTEGGGKTFAQAFAESFAKPSPNHTANVDRTMPLWFEDSPGINTVPVPPSVPLAVPDTYTGSACRTPHAPARLEIEDPRGNENEWDWKALPPELIEQLSILNGGKKDRHVAAVRLLWYWPDLGAQEAQELAVQTCGLYIDKGLDIREALATAATDRRRKDGLQGFGRFLSRWLGIELDRQHKANRAAGGPGIVEPPKKQAAWEIEATRIQKLWDEKHGKEPAAG